MLKLLLIEEADGRHGKARFLGFGNFGTKVLFVADFLQFARVEPIAGAIRAVVDFDPLPGAEEMALEFHASAAGAITLASVVNDEPRIALNAQEVLVLDFVLFVHALEFEGVKPEAAAAAVAGVDIDAAEVDFRKFVGTGGAVHGGRRVARESEKLNELNRLHDRLHELHRNVH